MARKGSLKAALDAAKGKDDRLEQQKRLRKKAEKAKRAKGVPGHDGAAADGMLPAEDVDNGEEQSTGANGAALGDVSKELNAGTEKDDGLKEVESDGADGSESGEDEEVEGTFDISRIDESDSGSDIESHDEAGNGGNKVRLNGKRASPRLDEAENPFDQLEDEEDDEDADGDEDIALSDLSSLSSTAKEDIIPHQRLTINNSTALLSSLNSFALPLSELSFSEHQSVTTAEPVSIPDIDDDLNRELAFYKQSLDAVKQARSLLKAESVPFSRPTDYFAEMVKSDEHMGRIKEKLVDEAAGKKAAAEARKQRDLKKFGKQVQVAKLQERDKAKRETLEKIQLLKRKRKNAPDTGNAEETDMFDVALEDAAASDKRSSHRDRRSSNPAAKRQKRDQKFGFGGKKRFSKSGDAISSGDLRAFSMKKMKGHKKGTQRLGKSRRAKKG